MSLSGRNPPIAALGKDGNLHHGKIPDLLVVALAMEIANEDELCAWLRTRARVHPEKGAFLVGGQPTWRDVCVALPSCRQVALMLVALSVLLLLGVMLGTTASTAAAVSARPVSGSRPPPNYMLDAQVLFNAAAVAGPPSPSVPHSTLRVLPPGTSPAPSPPRLPPLPPSASLLPPSLSLLALNVTAYAAYAPVLREALALAQSLPQPGKPCLNNRPMGLNSKHTPCFALSEQEAAITHPNGGVRHLPFRHTSSSTGVRSVLCLIEKSGSTAMLHLLEHDRHLAPAQLAGGVASTVAPPVLTIVRNPYARLLSAYLDKAARHKRGITFNGTFPEFAVHLASCVERVEGHGSCPRSDLHFAPQLSHCHLSDGFHYDLVLRLEEMPRWYEAVINLLGLRVAAQSYAYGSKTDDPAACFFHPQNVSCDELFRTEEPRSYGGASTSHKDSHATYASERVLAVYTPLAAQAATTLYRADAAQFGYRQWDGTGPFELAPGFEPVVRLDMTGPEDSTRPSPARFSSGAALPPTQQDLGTTSAATWSGPVSSLTPPAPRAHEHINVLFVRTSGHSGSDWVIGELAAVAGIQAYFQFGGSCGNETPGGAALAALFRDGCKCLGHPQYAAARSSSNGHKDHVPYCGGECSAGVDSCKAVIVQHGNMQAEELGFEPKRVLWRRANRVKQALSELSHGCPDTGFVNHATEEEAETLRGQGRAYMLHVKPDLLLEHITGTGSSCARSPIDAVTWDFIGTYEALQLDREAELSAMLSALGISANVSQTHHASSVKVKPEAIAAYLLTFDEVNATFSESACLQQQLGSERPEMFPCCPDRLRSNGALTPDSKKPTLVHTTLDCDARVVIVGREWRHANFSTFGPVEEKICVRARAKSMTMHNTTSVQVCRVETTLRDRSGP